MPRDWSRVQTFKPTFYWRLLVQNFLPAFEKASVSTGNEGAMRGRVYTSYTRGRAKKFFASRESMETSAIKNTTSLHKFCT